MQYFNVLQTIRDLLSHIIGLMSMGERLARFNHDFLEHINIESLELTQEHIAMEAASV